MNPDIEDIVGLLARAKQFADTVPKGDVRLHFVPSVNMLCEGIGAVLALPVVVGSVEAAEWMGRLAVMLAQLRGFLDKMQALDLAQEIGRAHAKVKEQTRPATEARRENADVAAKKLAERWIAACETNPTYSAKMILAQVIQPELRIGEKALKKRLARARRLGLIPARHRRSES